MRLYNGCPDSELKAIWDDHAACHREALSLGIHLTYFPVEERWAAYHLKPPYVSLGTFHHSRRGALEEAITLLAELESSLVSTESPTT